MTEIKVTEMTRQELETEWTGAREHLARAPAYGEGLRRIELPLTEQLKTARQHIADLEHKLAECERDYELARDDAEELEAQVHCRNLSVETLQAKIVELDTAAEKQDDYELDLQQQIDDLAAEAIKLEADLASDRADAHAEFVRANRAEQTILELKERLYDAGIGAQ